MKMFDCDLTVGEFGGHSPTIFQISYGVNFV